MVDPAPCNHHKRTDGASQAQTLRFVDNWPRLSCKTARTFRRLLTGVS